MKPVYIDGPLKGQRFDTPDPFPVVYAHDPDGCSVLETRNMRSYQLRRVGFHMGGKAVTVWVGWCGGEAEPDAETVCRALFRDDVMERAEVNDMPFDPCLERS